VNSVVTQPMVQGLIIAAVGMTLVFAALALLWGLTRLLTMVLADKVEPPAPEPSMVFEEADAAEAQAALEAAASAEAALTEERAQVAAMVAGALLSNALPLLFPAPTGGPAFEHGRIAPSWVTSNRARTLHPWQPPRVAESGQQTSD
jgi:Na+-transporting methylmalonyl-CoA/oxaloacetate decarboxylase gamma subunit